jgi:hypothetical protein
MATSLNFESDGVEAMETNVEGAGAVMPDVIPVATQATESNRPKRKSGRNSTVRFEEDVVEKVERKSHPIVLEEKYYNPEVSTLSFGVYLGFLQDAHKYEIRFRVAVDRLRGLVDPEKMHLNGPLFRGENITWKVFKEPIHEVEFCLEKLEVEEPDTLALSDGFMVGKDQFPDKESPTVDFQLTAQVLGKGMGTPVLRDGIRCLGAVGSKPERKLSSLLLPPEACYQHEPDPDDE